MSATTPASLFPPPRRRLARYIWKRAWLHPLLSAPLLYVLVGWWSAAALLLAGLVAVLAHRRGRRAAEPWFIGYAVAMSLAVAVLAVASGATGRTFVGQSVLLALAAGPLIGLMTLLRPAIGSLAFAAVAALYATAAGSVLAREGLAAPLAGYALGLLLAPVLREQETAHATLAAFALNDPLTGLGNRHSLTRDFARYRALAQREDRAFLMILWRLEASDGLGEGGIGDDGVAEFARSLVRQVRRGDSAFLLERREYVTLHVGLESGAAVAERVRTRHPDVAVDWLRVDAYPSHLSFDELRGLALRRSAAAPGASQAN